MRDSTLLRRAAQQLEHENWGYACTVMGQILRGGAMNYARLTDEHQQKAEEVAERWLRQFAPEKIENERRHGWFGIPCGEEMEVRILAVCFAAADAAMSSK